VTGGGGPCWNSASQYDGVWTTTAEQCVECSGLYKTQIYADDGAAYGIAVGCDGTGGTLGVPKFSAACGAEAACEDKVIGDSCGTGGSTCNSLGQCRECDPAENDPITEKNPDCIDSTTHLTGTCNDDYVCEYPPDCTWRRDCEGNYCCTKLIGVNPAECVPLATLAEEDRQICDYGV